MSPIVEPPPESFLFGEPRWAADLRNQVAAVAADVRSINRKVTRIMALSDDLQSTITDLTNTVTSVLSEDGQILAIVQDLATKAQNGSVSDADVQSAIDQVGALRSQVQAQADSLLSAAQAADPSFTPPAV